MKRSAVAFSAAVLCAACLSSPEAQLTELPAASLDGVAGAYCYVDPLENVTVAERGPTSRANANEDPENLRAQRESGFQVLPLVLVQRASQVHVMRDGEQITIQYTLRTNGEPRMLTWPIAKEARGVVELTLPDWRGGAAFGIGGSKRWAQLLRGEDGRLTLIEHYREQGLAFLLIPFREHQARRLDLDPVARCAD